MKHSNKHTILILCGMLCLFSAVYAQEATVTAVSGKVERKDFDTWVTLAVGDTLKKGDVISTGFKSSVDLELNDAKVSIGPLTRASIEQLMSTDTANTTKIALASGKLSADVNPQQNKRVSFKVTSPVATLSVRGTVFSVYADGTFKTERGVVSKLPPEKAKTTDDGTEAEEGGTEAEEGGAEAEVDEGRWAGVPVAANQISTTDSSTGVTITPQVELVTSAQSVGGSTTTLAASESVVSTASSLTVGAEGPVTEAKNTMAQVVLTIVF